MNDWMVKNPEVENLSRILYPHIGSIRYLYNHLKKQDHSHVGEELGSILNKIVLRKNLPLHLRPTGMQEYRSAN